MNRIYLDNAATTACDPRVQPPITGKPAVYRNPHDAGDHIYDRHHEKTESSVLF